MRARVAIVGAGPGGCAAAIALARQGVEGVVLLERDRLPRDKACGSALSPNALQVLDHLELGAEVRRLGYKIHSLRMKTRAGREMHLTTDHTAYILLRKEFDHLLARHAQSLGVELRDGFRVDELLVENGRVTGVRGPGGEVRAEYVLCADGARAAFSRDPRPRRAIMAIVGWWEGFPIEPGTLEMVFDRKVAPLYGWMFPETPERVNLGICIEGPGTGAPKRKIRDVFQQFLDDHYADRLKEARPLGRWQGHPISYTTWIGHCTGPGVLHLGEAARLTHLATGEGIYHAMQSGVYAAEALAAVIHGKETEASAWHTYTGRCRKQFTGSFVMGHVLRAMVSTPVMDGIVWAYNRGSTRKLAARAVGSALAGSHVSSDQKPTA